MRFHIRRPSLPRLPSLPSLPAWTELPALPSMPSMSSMANGVHARVQSLRAVLSGATSSMKDAADAANALEEELRAEGILVDNYRPSQVFTPRRVLQNGTAQTVLARRKPLNSIALRLEQPILLDAGHDHTEADPSRPVRMIGYYNPPVSPGAHRGLVLLIHGWEGSSHSADLLYMADSLLRAGFSTFRLNLRDHGPNLHVDRLALNRGLFIGTLLEEVHTATQQIAALAGGAPFFLAGGSMGGNFVLRMAARHNEHPIPNLTKVVALCPAISPAAAVDAIDAQSAYRAFFRNRWLVSLKAKQRHFPDVYDFRDIERVRWLREMTDKAIPRHSVWTSADDYFSHYTFGNEDAARLRVPTAVIAAADDHVIPVRDIYRLEPHDCLTVQIHRTGGHMGFVDIFPYRRWLPQAVLDELRAV